MYLIVVSLEVKNFAAEIKKLLEKGGIIEATHYANEYISTVFKTQKRWTS